MRLNALIINYLQFIIFKKIFKYIFTLQFIIHQSRPNESLDMKPFIFYLSDIVKNNYSDIFL